MNHLLLSCCDCKIVAKQKCACHVTQANLIDLVVCHVVDPHHNPTNWEVIAPSAGRGRKKGF